MRLQNDDQGLTFYDGLASPCARRVRITLRELGITPKVEMVDLVKGEQKSSQYLAINPWGKVPALLHQGRPIWESNVITQYLDEVFPHAGLYPREPMDYAKVRSWQEYELGFAKPYFMLMYQRVIGPMTRLTSDFDEFMSEVRQSSDDPTFIRFKELAWKGELLTPGEEAANVATLETVLANIEKALSVNGAYLCGQAFSQADISVYPRLRMFPYLGVRILESKFPLTVSWMDRLEQRSSIKYSLSFADLVLSNSVAQKMLGWATHVNSVPAKARTAHQRIGYRVLRALFKLDMALPDKLFRRLLPKGEMVERGARPLKGSTSTLSADELVFYHAPLLPDSMAAQRSLACLGIAHSTVTVDTAIAEELLPQKLPLESLGRLPALQINGQVTVVGLGAIVDYLHKRYFDVACVYFPVDPYDRAMARIQVLGDSDGAHKYLRNAYDQYLVAASLTADRFEQLQINGASEAQLERMGQAVVQELCTDEELRGVYKYLGRHLEQVEKLLQQTEYLCGRTFGFADIAVFSRLESYRALGFEWQGQYPLTTQWAALVEEKLNDH